MLKTIKKLSKGLYNKFCRFQLYYKNKDILNTNKKLENTLAGKRCFIMGTGPSIKNQDLTKLKNEYTFIVNTFGEHPQIKEINPKFYVLADTILFQKSDNNYWLEKFISNAELLSKLSINLFFNVQAKKIIESDNLFAKNIIHYLVSDGFFRENLNFNIDINKVIPNTKNVIIASILIATYMGFEKIYLLGCEHDFLAYPSNYEWTEHFYKTEDFNINNPQDVKKYNLTLTTYEEAIHNALMLFRNYRLLKTKLAKEKPRVRIYNATPNSFLDVFPRVKFEDIKFDGK